MEGEKGRGSGSLTVECNSYLASGLMADSLPAVGMPARRREENRIHSKHSGTLGERNPEIEGNQRYNRKISGLHPAANPPPPPPIHRCGLYEDMKGP